MDSRGNLSEMLKLLTNRSYYASALVRAAISKEEDPKLIGGSLVLSDRAVTEPRTADYGKVMFVERALDVKDSSEWLTHMINDQVASLDGMSIPTKGDFEAPFQIPENFVPSDYGYFPIEWGCNHYRYRITADRGSLPGSLPLKADLPLFPDSSSALSDWLKMPPGFDIQGLFLFFLPNMEARIGQISFSPKSVGISLLPGRGSFSDMRGKAFVQDTFSGSAYKPPLNTDLAFPDGKTDIPVSFKPAFLYVTLLDRGGEIVDYRKFWPTYSSQPGLKFEVTPDEIERLVLQGENESVEFKRGLQNHHDIAETIVSFSNGKGGLILVGVDDQCNILGASDLANETLTKVEERIRNFADDLCDPAAKFNLTMLKIQGKDVLVIEVKEGSEKPYWLKNKGAMTRSGSNDRPATRYEAQQMFHKPTGPFG